MPPRAPPRGHSGAKKRAKRSQASQLGLCHVTQYGTISKEEKKITQIGTERAEFYLSGAIVK